MKRYRVRLAYPRITPSRTIAHEYIWAADAVVLDGFLFFKDRDGVKLAGYRPGQWNNFREVGS